ncbi:MULTISPECIES: copper resistance CopC family protein [unclassified Streptosporangium]|uniref:copper resistance CopC family protein n=1 Tax=unclassified Streptosporangium TaxID=2632669 RepID=UPI002E29541D|nr:MULTISPECIES: copper resistance protein CopC [unclassified Streptosporangium]
MASLPRFARTTVVTALLCAVFLTLGTPAALAHDRLKSSSPDRGAKVAALERIKLVFTTRVRFPAVALREAGGTTVDLGKPKVDGDTVTSGVPETLASGKYVIAWRVVSTDGHPIEGEIPFTVTAPATPSATAEPTPEPAPAAESTPAPESSAPGTPAPETSATTAPPTPAPGLVSATDDRESDGQGLPGWTWIALLALVVVGTGVWFRVSRRDEPGGAE